ncbi:MAG: hypothetical protein HDS68_04865, partial [Bacteroidales bacterium]|nr:hypothetical protein [Bacteroidales bacterium]
MKKIIRILLCVGAVVLGCAICYADNTQEELEDWLDDFTIEELLARGIPGETVPLEKDIPSIRGYYEASVSLSKKTFTREDRVYIERKVKHFIVNYERITKRTQESEKRKQLAFKAYVDSIKSTGIEINGHVYFTADKPPYKNDLNGHFAKHFRYPKEAWKKERHRSAVIHGIVLKNGKMVGIEVTSTETPELVAELKRVTELIDWTPARNGRYWMNEQISDDLNCYRSFYVNLTPSSSHADNSPYAAFIPATGTSTVPYGLESV